MSIPDKKRDRRFKKDMESGLSIKRLAGKYRLSERQISRIKKRLGEKEAARKPAKQTARKPERQKRVKATFQIPEDIFMQIKIKAARERKRISDLVGEIFSQYLKGKKW